MISLSLIKTFSALAAIASLVGASPVTHPEIIATAAFPAANAQSQIVNGQRNAMTLTIENFSKSNVTLTGAAGSIHNPESDVLLRNTTSVSYGVTLISGAKTVLPYNFYSEYKPGDVKLKLWVNVDDGAPSGQFRVPAYESIIPVVEPPKGWFDLPLLFAYAVLAAILGGSGYFIYQTAFPQPKKTKKVQVSAPVGKVTASTTSGSYQEEWIPVHHLKPAKKDGAASSSGDESAPEKRKGKGKGKKA